MGKSGLKDQLARPVKARLTRLVDIVSYLGLPGLGAWRICCRRHEEDEKDKGDDREDTDDEDYDDDDDDDNINDAIDVDDDGITDGIDFDDDYYDAI